MTETAGISGKLCTLSIEGAALAESQNFTLTCGKEVVDLTNRDSAFWRQLIGMKKSWSISGDGLYIYGDVAKKILVANWSGATQTMLTVILTLADGTITATGEAWLTALSFPAPHDAAATISFTLEGTDALVFSVS
jgi:predicted secreted protein